MVTLRVLQEHPVFKRTGNDLVMEKEIPLEDALTGASFTIEQVRTYDSECCWPYLNSFLAAEWRAA